MSKENLQQRLIYFEGKLDEATRKLAAKEPHTRDFDAGFTTDTLKTWADSIALINERIARIKDQLRME